MSNEQNADPGAMLALSVSDAAEMDRLEAAIRESFKRHYREVGDALSVIRDKRYYLRTHTTFESYCAEMWGITDRRSRQSITAAEAADDVERYNRALTGTVVPKVERCDAITTTPAGESGTVVPNVERCAPIPTNEGQARELAKAPREQRGPVMAKAIVKAAAEGKPVTARHVQEAVNEIIPQAKVPTRPGATGKRAAGVSSFDAGADVGPYEEAIDLTEAREIAALMEEWANAGQASGGGRQRDRVAEYLRAFAAWIKRQ